MMQSQFKMSDKAFYCSRFSGIIPCEIIDIGPKKIYISIEGYNKKIWVSAKRLVLQSEWPAQIKKESFRWLKKYNRKILSTIYIHLPVLQELNND